MTLTRLPDPPDELALGDCVGVLYMEVGGFCWPKNELAEGRFRPLGDEPSGGINCCCHEGSAWDVAGSSCEALGGNSVGNPDGSMDPAAEGSPLPSANWFRPCCWAIGH